MFSNCVRDAREEVGLQKKGYADWTEEEHAEFSKALYTRIAQSPRNPEVDKPPEGANYSDVKAYNAAMRPVAPTTVYRNPEDGSRLVGAFPLNFKNGAPETTTRSGKVWVWGDSVFFQKPRAPASLFLFFS